MALGIPINRTSGGAWANVGSPNYTRNLMSQTSQDVEWAQKMNMFYTKLAQAEEQFNKSLGEKQREYNIGQENWQKEFDLSVEQWAEQKETKDIEQELARLNLERARLSQQDWLKSRTRSSSRSTGRSRGTTGSSSQGYSYGGGGGGGSSRRSRQGTYNSRSSQGGVSWSENFYRMPTLSSRLDAWERLDAVKKMASGDQGPWWANLSGRGNQEAIGPSYSYGSFPEEQDGQDWWNY